jgi:hypothetical protein
MGFDVFVQRFADGSPTTFDRRHFDRIFASHARDAGSGCVVLNYSDGGGGEAYLDEEAEIGSIMISRPGGEGLFDDLYRLISEIDGVLFWPDAGPSLVVPRQEVIADLPSDMLEDIGPAVIVNSGAEIVAAIRRG